MPGAVKDTPHATRIWNGTERKGERLGRIDSDPLEDMVFLVKMLLQKRLSGREVGEAQSTSTIQAYSMSP